MMHFARPKFRHQPTPMATIGEPPKMRAVDIRSEPYGRLKNDILPRLVFRKKMLEKAYKQSLELPLSTAARVDNWTRLCYAEDLLELARKRIKKMKEDNKNKGLTPRRRRK